MINQERLKELLHYNPGTGIFTWMVNRRSNLLKGCTAGWNQLGYIMIGIDGLIYQAHRLAILYMDGYLPEGQVDHKDRIKHHNWYSNLRPDVTHQCNMRNKGLQKNNTSGFTGLAKRGKKWCVCIYINKHQYNFHRGDDLVEAVAHRLAAEQCLDWCGHENSDSKKYIDNYLKEINNGTFTC